MNIQQMLKQAQQMQRRVDKAKKAYEEKVFDFTSQQDLIKGKINGKPEITEISIDSSLLNEENKSMLEDLLTVTINEQVKAVIHEKEKLVNNITNGVDVSAFL